MPRDVGVQGLPKALRHFDPQSRWTSGRGGEIYFVVYWS
jgi:hypothetical protein